MIWNRFESDRAEIESIYNGQRWNPESGLTPRELYDGCHAVAKECEGEPRIVAKTRMYKFVLENAQLDVREADFFPERLRHDYIISRIREEWIKSLRANEMRDVLASHEDGQEGLCYTGNIDLGHCAPDWQSLLDYGFVGLLERAKAAHKKEGLTKEQDLFYECVESVLESTIAFVGRLADEMAKHGTDRAALVSESLRNLTFRAPETMLEAMQICMIYYNLQTHVEREPIRSVGGLDRLFYPYFKRDMENGRFTESQLRELLRYYFFKFYSMKVVANVPFYLGGRLSDGSGAINPLSYIIVEEYSSLNVNDPKIHVRWYDEIPESFVKLVLTSIRDGKNSFVFVNDNVVEKALVNIGEEPADARNYIVIGCYEPCAMGKEIPCTCAGRANMTKALLTVMYGGTDNYTGKKVGTVRATPDSYKTFDEFYAAVKEQIVAFLDGAMDLVNAYEEYYPVFSQAPLLSATYEPCIESGRDAYDHGAKYCNSSIVAFSVASTADALVAVKKLVYEEKALTLSEFAEILANNWEGHEALHRRVLRKMPKYGNGLAEPDTFAKEIVDFAASYVNGKPNKRGGVFRLGLFSIDYRISFGERMGASPDGRVAGEMLSKNMGAVTAMDKEGVTALIKSVTEIDYSGVPDGTVLDVMLHSTATEGEEGIVAMYALLTTYMKKNGFAFQMNVLSPDVLRRAQAEPEKYTTLQVRLCGWNVYFVELSKTEQDDLIRQCENAAG